MAGIKRKSVPANKPDVRRAAIETQIEGASSKKRKLTLQPRGPAAGSKSLVKAADDSSDDDGGVDATLSDEEAARFGPSAQERGEAETDSDPIVEADTTEQSGDDDGVSWPSDGDEYDEEAILPPSKATQDQGIEVKVSKATNEEEDRITIGSSSVSDRMADKTLPNAASLSRESHAKQKALAQERKAAKPNADSIARTKKLWERLRRKSHVPRDERKQLVAELFGIITGHVKDFVLKHDSVRVVQTALKYANIDQRKMTASELKGEYRHLAESRYAKFLIGKLLVPSDKDIRDMIVPEFYGHVRRMIKHSEASWILDDVYRGAATPVQKAILLREWYGAEFALFKVKDTAEVTADVASIMAKHPEKKKSVMHALHDLINQCIQKKTTGFTMLHDAMLQYYLNVQQGSTEAIEFLELLKGDEEGDLLKNLAFTKSGSRIVCLALAYGNAKDRKLILRTYKDTIQALAYDIHGHQVLLAAYNVIDDTVLLAKSIFSELVGKEHSSETSQQNLLAATNHLSGRVPLLYPFTGEVKSLLCHDDQKLLKEVHAIRTITSKKDPEVRRKELVNFLSPPLLFLIEKNAQSLISSNLGCYFMTEVLLSCVGDRKPALGTIANLALDDTGADSGVHSSDFARLLKSLVQGGRYNQKTKTLDRSDPPLGFHDMLYPKIQARVVDWAVGGTSFVILALYEARDFSYNDELGKTLRKGKKQIVDAAGAGNRGSQLLLQKLEQ
ncbi:MAG: hypothetical protein Q9195_002949 [Heterodermia aff. obscurata]